MPILRWTPTTCSFSSWMISLLLLTTQLRHSGVQWRMLRLKGFCPCRGSRARSLSNSRHRGRLLKSRMGPKWEKMMRARMMQARAGLHRRRARRRRPQLRSQLCLQLLTLLPSRLNRGLRQMMSGVPRRLIQVPSKGMEPWKAPSIARTGLQRQRQRRCQLQLHLMVKFLRLVTLRLCLQKSAFQQPSQISTACVLKHKSSARLRS